MPDRLIVSDVRTDEASIAVEDALTERLSGLPSGKRRLGLWSVTNAKVGEADEEPRTYFVQKLSLGLPGHPGEDTERVETWSCTCKGYKYHSLPEMGTFDADGPEAFAEGLEKVGICKHIEEVMYGKRSEGARRDDQATLTET